MVNATSVGADEYFSMNFTVSTGDPEITAVIVEIRKSELVVMPSGESHGLVIRPTHMNRKEIRLTKSDLEAMLGLFEVEQKKECE